tara:strand:- start:10732 stop:11205 length:474 start_codon:yes stop_codon:yes gene_type:complete
MKEFKALKWLCYLSFIGFLYCFVTDAGFCFAFFEASDDINLVNESLRAIIENWTDKGFVYDEFMKNQLIKFYAIRIVFDILALVGVILMFLKAKLGWTFYWIFQLAYVLSPFMLLDFEFTSSWPYFTGFALLVTPIFNAIIHLVYVLLFFSQKKNLT